MSDQHSGLFRVVESDGRVRVQGSRSECEEYIAEMEDGQLEELMLHGRDDLTGEHWETVC